MVKYIEYEVAELRGSEIMLLLGVSGDREQVTANPTDFVYDGVR